MKLLEKGLEGGNGEDDVAGLRLVYTVEVPFKRDRPGKLKIPVKAEGSGIGRVVLLLKRGLERPPATIMGE